MVSSRGLGDVYKRQVQAPIPVQVIDNGVQITEERPAPPEGFLFSESGVKVSVQGADGIIRFAPVCDTVTYAVNTYDRGGERFVQFAFYEHSEKKSFMMPLSAVASRDDGIKAFAKVGVMVANGQENAFRSYIKASVALAKRKPPIKMPTSLGWQEDNSFCLLYTSDAADDTR